MDSTAATTGEPPGPRSTAQEFGALIRRLAIEAGYDMSPKGGGRIALARDTGMSESAVGRMINGHTLPMPAQFENLARVLHTDVRNLLVAAGVISREAWPEGVIPDVRSATSQSPQSPEAFADSWGITDPVIRQTMVGAIEMAIRLQRGLDTEHSAAHTGAP
ncbi:helix-turn-helix transcriptional regulator [Streptomyces sp. KAU_LT]|uniref:helix-turn-helix domain-containing protein n=1 Tax=Streptomyces sp. KAU_LT TaxID=3046669 RepID=UPI0024B70A41|nr:helix-turn-helix transcriptional regulator [Streptomyces sp. KAU_LT]MDI9836205.1 helix-turn-helix transcriptional regulator [Streptomyces sp. KAU_LT]